MIALKPLKQKVMKFSKSSGTKITLFGSPISTQHAYGQHGKIRYMKKDAKDRKEQYQWEAKSQWKSKIIGTPIKIAVALFFGDKRVRDWDNYHKISMDALSGIVWEDDSQVQEALITKHYDKENPRIEIEVSEFDSHILPPEGRK